MATYGGVCGAAADVTIRRLMDPVPCPFSCWVAKRRTAAVCHVLAAGWLACS